MTKCVGTQAWSDVVMAGPLTRFFEFEDVERFDADAVRLCDGYEYRYYRGGRFTWFSKSTCAELPVRDWNVMPRHTWLHLPDCRCVACAPT